MIVTIPSNIAIYNIGSTLGKGDKLVFANGGDRTNQSTPNINYITITWIEFEFGVGGEKQDEFK